MGRSEDLGDLGRGDAESVDMEGYEPGVAEEAGDAEFAEGEGEPTTWERCAECLAYDDGTRLSGVSLTSRNDDEGVDEMTEVEHLQDLLFLARTAIESFGEKGAKEKFSIFFQAMDKPWCDLCGLSNALGVVGGGAFKIAEENDWLSDEVSRMAFCRELDEMIGDALAKFEERQN